MTNAALVLILFLFCLAVIYGAICDAKTFTIPNRVSYGLVGLFAAYALLLTLTRPTLPHLDGGFHLLEDVPILWNIFYGFVVFVFFIVFWKLRWVGGGDVKFVSAISLFMGLENIALFGILLSVLSVGFLLAIKLLELFAPLLWHENVPSVVRRFLLQFGGKVIPYGVPAAIAALVLMPKVFTQVS